MIDRRLTSAAGAALCVLAASACADSTGPEDADRVAVRFASVMPAPAQGSVEGSSLELTGSNGTLRIDEMYFIVAEFELEGDDAVCDDDFGDDDCEEFEAPPAFLDVPLDGSGVIAVQHTVPAGTYRKLDFEVEDLDDDDEDDSAKAQQIAALRAQILAQFPDWPRDASVLVIGSFTPTGGQATPFRVYFEAEIEIEMDLVPPVVIDGTGTSPAFTVRIDPNMLFRNGDGTVRNLAPLDFTLTGQVIEFEVEIENGVSEIEFDD